MRVFFLVISLVFIVPVHAADGLPDQPFVQAHGSASIDIPPDGVRINLGAIAKGETASEARAAVDEKVQAIAAILHKAGLPKDGFEAYELEVEEVVYWRGRNRTEDGERENFYQAERSLRITVRELDKLQSYLDALLDAPVSYYYSIRPFIDDKKPYLEDVLKQAIHAAQERARLYAEAAGAEVGDVYRIGDDTGLSKIRFESVAISPIDIMQTENSTILGEQTLDRLPGEVTLPTYRLADVTLEQSVTVIFLLE